MAMSSLTYILGLSVKFFFRPMERGLSVTNFIITKERNQLHEAAINGLRAKDVVKFYDTELMRPEKILMNKHVLSARNFHFDY